MTPRHAALAAFAVTLLATAGAAPLTLAAVVAAGMHLHRRLRRWRPSAGVRAGALASVAAAFLAA